VQLCLFHLDARHTTPLPQATGEALLSLIEALLLPPAGATWYVPMPTPPWMPFHSPAPLIAPPSRRPLALPSPPPLIHAHRSGGDASVFWAVALRVASLPPSPSPSAGAGSIRRLRPPPPRVGLYEAWRRELQHSPSSKAEGSLSSRVGAVLSRLALLVAGLSDGAAAVATGEPPLPVLFCSDGHVFASARFSTRLMVYMSRAV
jgi:hypothetical protein